MICRACPRPPSGEAVAATCSLGRNGPTGGVPGIDCVPTPPLPDGPWPDDDDPNPFVRYRTLLWPYTVGRRHGLTDADLVGMVRDLDAAVADVWGRGFTVTPLRSHDGLAGGGPVRVKDETGAVAGSHKARHLFGLLWHIEVVERLGLDRADGPLAIASCGNAALAAAVVAAAGRRPLRVLVPAWADAGLLHRISSLGADVEVCGRRPGEAGDPAYLRFREAVDAGAVPFGCQGPDNGLTLDGARTLGYELADQLAAAGADHVVVQVGGGALATSVTDGLRAAVRCGRLRREPALHAVQTAGGHPLVLAHERVLALRRAGEDDDALVDRAARQRSAVMIPWSGEPHSAATGILDDETYDWQAVVRAMLRTGGGPVVVDEATLAEAARRGRAAGVDVSVTGAAGLAGLLALVRSGTVGPDETAVVLFTGRAGPGPQASEA